MAHKGSASNCRIKAMEVSFGAKFFSSILSLQKKDSVPHPSCSFFMRKFCEQKISNSPTFHSQPEVLGYWTSTNEQSQKWMSTTQSNHSQNHNSKEEEIPTPKETSRVGSRRQIKKMNWKAIENIGSSRNTQQEEVWPRSYKSLRSNKVQEQNKRVLVIGLTLFLSVTLRRMSRQWLWWTG